MFSLFTYNKSPHAIEYVPYHSMALITFHGFIAKSKRYSFHAILPGGLQHHTSLLYSGSSPPLTS